MNLRTLLHLASPYRRSLVAVGILTVGSSLVLLAIPWLAGQMVGGVIAQTASIGRLVSLLILALVMLALLNIAVSVTSATTAARLLADLRVRIYEHLQRLPFGFHENHRQGDTLALATFEVARLSQFLTDTLVTFPSRLLTVVGAVILMFQIDPRLALLVPLLVPAFYLILKIVGRRSARARGCPCSRRRPTSSHSRKRIWRCFPRSNLSLVKRRKPAAIDRESIGQWSSESRRAGSMPR